MFIYEDSASSFWDRINSLLRRLLYELPSPRQARQVEEFSFLLRIDRLVVFNLCAAWT